MKKQAELYRGKAKTVYSTDNPDLLVLEFRNDSQQVMARASSSSIVKAW